MSVLDRWILAASILAAAIWSVAVYQLWQLRRENRRVD